MNNPYTAPIPSSQSTGEPQPHQGHTSNGFPKIARSIFLAWERLRIIYILILAGITLLMVLPADVIRFRTVRLILEGALIANLLFFLGPSLETYLRWLGFERKWIRSLTFCCGTILSIILAFLTLGAELFSSWLPNQN